VKSSNKCYICANYQVSSHSTRITITQEAERNKKLRIDAIKRDFVDTKEREHILYQQEKAMREKAWFDKRLSEIEQTTFKGIQPNIDRLMRKHQEDCEDIKCQTDVTKQKLKLTCEDDLMSRLAEFQNNVQQSKDSISNMNKISKSLAQEQNEHRTRIKIAKESLLEEEQNLRQMYDMELQSLIEQNSGELNKIKLSNSIQYLEKNLRSKMEQMEYEEKSYLDWRILSPHPCPNMYHIRTVWKKLQFWTKKSVVV
jgi:excinuclease UvrABC ATPase subunit